MYYHAFEMQFQSSLLPRQDQKNQGVLTHIALNYLEVMCIEIALVGLKEKLRHEPLPDVFSGVSRDTVSAHLRNVRHWLDQPQLRDCLRTDGNNTVWWPFTSSELVDWLLRICQTFMTEEAIFIVSAEAAGEAYGDYAELSFDEENLSHLANSMITQHVCAFQRYYNEIVRCYQPALVGKLEAVQRQDYPLFPYFNV